MSDGTSLDDLDHDGLVALLDRLCAAAGQPRMLRSAARASTDDELRAAIRRLQRQGGGIEEAVSSSPTEPKTAARVVASTPRVDRVRIFCVLVTSDATLVAQARAILRASAIPVVAVASSDDLATLIRLAMPTHVVIDSRAASVERLGGALGRRAHEVSILQGSNEAAVMAAVAAIAELRTAPR